MAEELIHVRALARASESPSVDCCSIICDSARYDQVHTCGHPIIEGTSKEGSMMTNFLCSTPNSSSVQTERRLIPRRQPLLQRFFLTIICALKTGTGLEGRIQNILSSKDAHHPRARTSCTHRCDLACAWGSSSTAYFCPREPARLS